MSSSLGTQQNSNGDGLTPLDHRMILQALYPNNGVLSGLEVRANSDLTYQVAKGVGVTSRGVSDGSRLFYWSGGKTPAVSAGDPSNPRIDIVWAKADDPTIETESVAVRVGVTSGTPSASPARPQLPSGVTELMSFTVQPGTSNLSTGAVAQSSVQYAIPYGSSLGLLGETHDSRNGSGDTTVNKFFVEHATKIYVPTDRLVELEYNICGSSRSSVETSWYAGFMVDGAHLPNAGGEFALVRTIASQTHTFLTTLTRGYHTVAMYTGLTNGPGPRFFHGARDANTSFNGRTLRVWDRGVAQ